jgi:hypothetical protein
MDNQWSHCQDSAFWNGAINRLNPQGQVVDGIVGEHAGHMSAWQDSQRAIFRIGVIEVHSQCQYLAQSTCRGVCVCHAILYRPRSPFGYVTPMRERQGRVLVPNHQPVCGGRLVEDSRFEGQRAIAKDLSGHSKQSFISRQGVYARKSHGVPDTGSAALYARLAHFGHEWVKILRTQHAGNNRESSVVNGA